MKKCGFIVDSSNVEVPRVSALRPPIRHLSTDLDEQDLIETLLHDDA